MATIINRHITLVDGFEVVECDPRAKGAELQMSIPFGMSYYDITPFVVKASCAVEQITYTTPSWDMARTSILTHLEQSVAGYLRSWWDAINSPHDLHVEWHMELVVLSYAIERVRCVDPATGLHLQFDTGEVLLPPRNMRIEDRPYRVW